MPTNTELTRRALLVSGAGTAGAAVLAACSSSGSNAPPSPSSAGKSAASAPSSAGAGTAASSASPSVAGGGPSAAGAAAPLTSLADIPVGEAVAVTLPDGKPGLVTRTSRTSAVCFSAICTHEGCTVKPDGTQLACPCHGSTFAVATGKVLGGPAPSGLQTVAVAVVGGQVVPA